MVVRCAFCAPPPHGMGLKYKGLDHRGGGRAGFSFFTWEAQIRGSKALELHWAPRNPL